MSKALAGLATRKVHERHLDEAKVEAHQLRKTLERLLVRGIGESELVAALNHDHWQNRIALRMAESDVTSGSTASGANQAFTNFCNGL
jgi:hypothetical protein